MLAQIADPLTDEEVETMLSTQEKSFKFNIAIGEEVRILSGPFENLTATVTDVDTVREKLTVKLEFLGREMSLDFALDEVIKVN